MKKIFYAVSAALLVLALVVPSIADTIRLKDGSVIRGQVIGFKDQQFTILIGAGSKGRRGRTTVYVEDIESIDFDSTANRDVSSRGIGDDSNEMSTSSEAASSARRTSPNSDGKTSSQKTSGVQPSSYSPVFFTIKIPVRADSVANGWTHSGLVVWKGQRLRITASGRVSLGKNSLGNVRWSTPAGDPILLDPNRLMKTDPAGGLIAVIGDDNDDFIFIGSKREFVAQRDGVLFLGVNEDNLTDNAGAYDVVIEAETGRPTPLKP